ncbi:MAG TPA: bifunctional hydroxymethylpyrimidine kinase/phosphomethylpyrimidine kinase [Burkholderiaceae bacterium]|nr:bifunctional hydroxymethylpyrimidine kinase/phosphomethylpyrimidine kinase [Burkholderiaceae bacterium]
MSDKERIPNALTIAGIDPSGGAGIYADLKAFSALRAYGAGVVAALTAQNTQGVAGVFPVPPEFVRQQIDVVFADLRIDAAKIGMLGTAPVTRAVADALAGPISSRRLAHCVVDPVMVAKSGDSLLARDAIAMLVEAVLPLATMLTPNLPEAGVLLRQAAPDTLRDMYRAAERLRRLLPDSGHRWVVLKGGHLPGDPIDLLHDGDAMIELPAARIATRNTHGTGCTLAAAIAALLPQRPDVPHAVRDARKYLLGAIAAAERLSVGHGHGPVHHFFHWWHHPSG